MQFLHELFRQILPGTNQLNELLGVVIVSISAHFSQPIADVPEQAQGCYLMRLIARHGH